MPREAARAAAACRVAHCDNCSRPLYFPAMSDTVTRGIRIQVASFYDADRSSPQEGYCTSAYRVRFPTVESDTVQLISRKWFITAANGEVQLVQGPGVMREQPVLA